MAEKKNYGAAIRDGFQYLLANHEEVFTIGQGLWSPWYVGSSMTDLDKEFGRERVIDTPVSELATTGIAVGAALGGYRPIVIHPRMDFMILAIDPIVNQAAKWHHMLGGGGKVPVTIRGIVNRGGEQGAQHSQALHSWFAHIPGLRVVMPASPTDARDLLIASALCDDPVLYIDDRWLYEWEEELPPVKELRLADERPKVRREGADITIVASSYSVLLALRAAEAVAKDGIDAEVIDLRIINPLETGTVIKSVSGTGRLLCIDGGWATCGLAGEVIARVVEGLDPGTLKARPARITLPPAPAPTSKKLEEAYYPTVKTVTDTIKELVRA